MYKYLSLFLRLQILDSNSMLIEMCSTLLHMSFLFYTIEILPGCHNLSFIMTPGNQSITRMIWLPSQIKNPNCLVEAMPSIVLSPDPNMQAKKIYSAGPGFGKCIQHIRVKNA